MGVGMGALGLSGRASRAAASLVLLLALGRPACAQEPKPAATPDAPADGQRIERRTLDDLLKSLEGADATEREVAERELASRKKDAVLPVAALLARAKTVEVRAAAVRVLKRIADPGAHEALLATFNDAKAPPELRADAAAAIGASKALAAVPALVDALADLTSLRVCEAARAALETMLPAAEAPIVAAWKAERARKPPRDGVLFRLLLVLGKAGGADARETLLGALRTPDRDPLGVPLRHHAAIALGHMGDKTAIEPLIAALEVEHEFSIAKYIPRALGELTGQDLPPQASRWRGWWEANKAKLNAPKRTFEPLPTPPAPAIPATPPASAPASRPVEPGAPKPGA